MTDNQFLLSEESIYLDTSFVLYGLYESIDQNAKMVEEARQIIGLLSMRDNYYISNIVLNELFNVIEKSGFQIYIDNKIIIPSLGITTEDWKKYRKEERDKYRNDVTVNGGYNIHRDIKKWRKDSKFTPEYKVLVIGEFENILASLGDNLKIITNFSDDEKYGRDFISCKKHNKALDSNDVNHYLLCCEYSIKGILTCDTDFAHLKDTSKKIIVLTPRFKLYQDLT